MRARIKQVILAAVLGLALPALAAPGGDEQARTIQREIIVQPGSGSWIGVGVSDVTADKLSALKLKEERGVEIVTVAPDCPAQQAGLKEHDVILELNGARVESVEQFRRMVREVPVGRTVKLLISRDGGQQTVNVKLGERPRAGHLLREPGERFSFTLPPMPRIEIPDVPEINIFSRSARLGMEGESLTKQLGEFFGIPGNEGVLVRSVTANTPAEKAGLKAGDVIIKVDSEKVRDLGDLRGALRERYRKTSLTLTVIRNRKEMTLTVPLESSQGSGERATVDCSLT